MASFSSLEARVKQAAENRDGLIDMFLQLDDDIPEITREMVGGYLDDVAWLEKNSEHLEEFGGGDLDEKIKDEMAYSKELEMIYKEKLMKKAISFEEFKTDLRILNANLRDGVIGSGRSKAIPQTQVVLPNQDIEFSESNNFADSPAVARDRTKPIFKEYSEANSPNQHQDNGFFRKTSELEASRLTPLKRSQESGRPSVKIIHRQLPEAHWPSPDPSFMPELKNENIDNTENLKTSRYQNQLASNLSNYPQPIKVSGKQYDDIEQYLQSLDNLKLHASSNISTKDMHIDSFTDNIFGTQPKASHADSHLPTPSMRNTLEFSIQNMGLGSNLGCLSGIADQMRDDLHRQIEIYRLKCDTRNDLSDQLYSLQSEMTLMDIDLHEALNQVDESNREKPEMIYEKLRCSETIRQMEEEIQKIKAHYQVLKSNWQADIKQGDRSMDPLPSDIENVKQSIRVNIDNIELPTDRRVIYKEYPILLRENSTEDKTYSVSAGGPGRSVIKSTVIRPEISYANNYLNQDFRKHLRLL
jgi:hypothetical protein